MAQEYIRPTTAVAPWTSYHIEGPTTTTTDAFVSFSYSVTYDGINILVEDNAALIEFRNIDGATWMGEIALPKGYFYIGQQFTGARIKNRAAGQNITFQLVAGTV